LSHREDAIAIKGVRSGGAAEIGGLKPGDVLASWNDTPLTPAGLFYYFSYGASPGDDVQLGIIRNGERLVVPVVLGGTAA
jgi:S1-C subfamily serine protease